MYSIYSNGALLGYTDSPQYCYKLPSGSAQIIGEKEKDHTATGIIYQGRIYNLPGYDEFDADTANVYDADEGIILTQHTKQIAQDQSVIGGVRTTRMYDPGEYLIIDGTLYRVTLPIPVDGYIAINTNVEATDIAAELNRLTKLI